MTKKRFLTSLAALFMLICTTLPAVAQQEAASKTKKASGNITLDFEDVEIRDLIRYMAETTGENFIVDNRVKGKVTVISPRPVPQDQALSVFESLLAASGFAIVPAGVVSRIMPQADAPQTPLDVVLDKKDEAGKRPDQTITRLIELNHVSVGSVAQVLKPLLSGDAILTAYDPNNTMLLTDRQANIERISKIIQKLDRQADDKTRAIDIVYLKNADAEDLAEVLNSMIRNVDETKDDGNESRPPLVAFRGHVAVEADKSTNALILSAEPNDMANLKQIIERLDIRRLQVYLETLIMEVSGEATDRFGIEWRSVDNFTDGTGISPFGGQTFDSGISQVASNPLNLPAGFAFGLAGGTVTFRGEEFTNVGLLLQAVKKDSSVNVLSTPQLLTLDNQEAEIIVGDTVPFLTGSFTTDGTGASNPFQTIERQDVGLTLRIRPQISEDGFVRMNIYQEISSVAEQAGAADLTTRKRSIRTTVVVPNNNMVALGGLIRDDVTTSDQQVPCLAGFTGVGELFKNSAATNTKTNLMVFIKPRIINSYGSMDEITREKYHLMRDLQVNQPDNSSYFVPHHSQPEADMVPEDMRYTPKPASPTEVEK